MACRGWSYSGTSHGSWGPIQCMAPWMVGVSKYIQHRKWSRGTDFESVTVPEL